MKWSTGVAPGDYGGPPTTSKLRKYWGGDEGDQLESDEYIWNKDFVVRFKRMIDDSADGDSLVGNSSVKEDPSDFLSLNRVMTLDSLDVDLSKEPTKPTTTLSQEPITSPSGKKAIASPKWRPAPTHRVQENGIEQLRLLLEEVNLVYEDALPAAVVVVERSGINPRAETVEVMFRGESNILAAESREQYFKLKKKLQILTFGIGGIGLVSAHLSYSPEIPARILVPEYGAMHLELVPMLIGFFMYKIATIVQAIKDALNGSTRKTQL